MSAPDPTSQSVLVVDDEKNVRLTVRQALEDLGLVVETAADGTEALDRLEESTYDLMLLDLRMPGLDGLEVLRRACRTAPDLPIVIITAHGSVQNAVQAMRRGAVDVLLKPISLDSLRDLVDRVLRRPSVEGAAAPYDEWMRLATWHVRHQRTEAARHCLQEAVEQDDERPEAHTLLGILAGTGGHVEVAREHLEAAVERDPDAATARLLLERLREDTSTFPVDRPAALTDALSSESDPTAEMQTISEPAPTDEDVPHRVLAVFDERIADGAATADHALTQLAASSARSRQPYLRANGVAKQKRKPHFPDELTHSQTRKGGFRCLT